MYLFLRGFFIYLIISFILNLIFVKIPIYQSFLISSFTYMIYYFFISKVIK